jgi:hypothetical protein
LWGAASSSAARTPGPSWVPMNRSAAALARERERGPAGGPPRQPHRSARTRERGHQSALLRGQYRSGHQGYPAAGTASGRPLARGALDSLVEGSGAVFEAKFMLPWSFSEQAAGEKYMPQLQPRPRSLYGRPRNFRARVSERNSIPYGLTETT